MRYLSLFSGVESASLAAEPMGWEPVAFCEVDEYPAAVLAHRWPDVPNLGDITKVDWEEFLHEHGRPDVIVGGSPCQSFSIAGGRESLGGESRLMFEYIRAIEEVRPRWFVWENVPGALNTRDEAFGQLIDSLQDIGYVSLAWRVLDAQFARVPLRDGDGRVAGWFGPVAQRRRRVFLVGHLGDGGSAAAVLFESKGVFGDTPSSKEKRKALAADAARGSDETDARGGLTSFKWFQGANARGIAAYDDGSTCTLTNSDSHQPAVAFEQNQRDEVRLVGGDGTISASLSAERWGNHKNETLVAEPMAVASLASNAEIGVGGGVTVDHSSRWQGCSVYSCTTSGGRDVFPSLCATDGKYQFIDNQSIDGGRLILEQIDE